MTSAETSRTPARVLVVEDDEAYRRFLLAELGDLGFEVDSAADGQTALESIESGDYSVVLMDIRLPGMDGIEVLRRIQAGEPGSVQVVMMTGHGSIDTAIEAMKLGAYDYLTKPCDVEEMRAVIQRAREHRELQRENAALRTVLRRREGDVEIVGRSRAVAELVARIERIGPTDASVMLLGESGTGKELAAQLIHRMSKRYQKPFVDVNCSAMPDTLFESEFFGHERGAFTGAGGRKEGLVEAADGGTLFLDEVSEMSVAVQAKLLRFLETGTFRRLGGVRTLSANVRVVSASNQPIDRLIEGGSFRRDLFFRLAVVTLDVAPLRDRSEDIALLAEHFVREFGVQTGNRAAAIDDDAKQALMAYEWPGNVRELRNAMESAVILCEGGVVRARDLPARVRGRSPQASGDATDSGTGPIVTLEDLERRHILTVLGHFGGHREQTARALGIGTKTLYRKLREFGEA
ncbi:MAG TPA: sigma-54 dependent transcriptional regulator [Blastocatellia bacterium]|nr:sigma-54 dependent transcriptional regulator [Blastocatellia bacterium]